MGLASERSSLTWRAPLVATIRLYSGLVLFTYVVVHLANHALGLISLDAMEAGKPFSIAPWRTLPGTVLLAGSAIAHVGAALWNLYASRSLRMPKWQWSQTLLGLLIPFLLVAHVLGTRFLVELWGVAHSYTLEMAFLWVMVPSAGIIQAVMLLVVWTHACLGIHYWLRLEAWYARLQPLAFSVALLLPALSLAGYVAAGNRVREYAAQDPSWLAQVGEAASVRPEMIDWVFGWADTLQLATAGLLIGLIGLRGARSYWQRRRRLPRLRYNDGRSFEIQPGMTMLEALREARVPHPSVCGGRGRCSTCRVYVGAGEESLPPPSAEELRVLERVSGGSHVRLACQVRPTADVMVTPLLPPTATPAHGHRRAAYRRSEEREVAILFSDLRGFTRFSEERLPYDVVFVLNRYRIAMSEAIESAGGVVNEFVGDGIMALFGLESDARDGCQRALEAVRRMRDRLDALNASLANELHEPLRMGIGIHTGPVIIGEMGYDHLKGITVVGDPVNTASRLEQLTKQFDATLVVSEEAARLAELEPEGLETHEVEIRGRERGLTVHVGA